MRRVLLIDNYDSFTYNLVQRLGEIDASLDLRVFRNNQVTADEIEELERVPVRVLAEALDPLGADDEGRVLTRDAGEEDPVASGTGDHVEAAEVRRNI